MKWIKIVSLALAVISLVSGYYSLDKASNVFVHSGEKNSGTIKQNSLDEVLIDTTKTIEKATNDTNKKIKKTEQEIQDIFEEVAKSIPIDIIGNSERDFLNQELSSLRTEIEKIDMANSKLSHIQAEVSNETDSNGFVILMAKLGFSLLFGLSALFVILSQKYEEDTQKWAFSVLSLISGVWIGTIS